MNTARISKPDSEYLTQSDHEISMDKFKLLIAEDSITESMRLTSMLSKLGYEVLSAKNGREALDILTDEPIPFIISDWRMPELSGIDLCRKLRADDTYGQPYFILLTGCDAPMDLVAGMEAGADDFITKPFIGEELRVRLQAGTRIMRLRNQLQEQYKQMEKALHNEELANQRIQEDLKSAAAMQRDLLPRGDSPFTQLEVASLFLPASVVAGDGFNYFPLDEEHMGFYHLDVAGHGIASAMLSFTLSRYLMPDTGGNGAVSLHKSSSGTELQNTLVPPNEVVALLNQHFLDHDNCGHYFTMIYGIINVKSGQGYLCQAGHPYPRLCRASGLLESLGNGGFPVGMLPDATYENTSFKLDIGDRLWLYSDGIPDCVNNNDQQLGMQQFDKLIQQAGGAPLSRISTFIEAIVDRWKGNRPLEDDISLLAIGKRE